MESQKRTVLCHWGWIVTTADSKIESGACYREGYDFSVVASPEECHSGGLWKLSLEKSRTFSNSKFQICSHIQNFGFRDQPTYAIRCV
jgi:hypothetical protein